MSRKIKDKQEQVNAIDDLVKRVGSYRSSEELAELYQFIKRFPQMSPYNMFLIHIQKPGSSFVASAEDWRRKYNRTVKVGARPLVILVPFGPVGFVFELGDTEGDPLPKSIERPFKTEGEKVDEAMWARLLHNLERYGIAYHESDMGTDAAGSIQWKTPETRRWVAKKKGKQIVWVYVRQCYDMIVNRKHSTEEKCATIAHELGHLFCGHLGWPEKTGMDEWPSRLNLSRNSEEFEAESVANLVCGRIGIKTPSEQYLADYLNPAANGPGKQIPSFSVENVLRAAGLVESMLKRTLPPPKKLVVEEEKAEEAGAADARTTQQPKETAP